MKTESFYRRAPIKEKDIVLTFTGQFLDTQNHLAGVCNLLNIEKNIFYFPNFMKQIIWIVKPGRQHKKENSRLILPVAINAKFIGP